MLGRSPASAAWLFAALGFLAGSVDAASADLPLPVAGVLAVSPAAYAGWSWSGRWRFPVGDPRDFRNPGPGHEPAFHLLRGVGDPDEGQEKHTGADLGCGHGGDPVHAAAAGLVLCVQRSVGTTGYGRYVVIGHRLPEGGLAYSIYAHLAAGSIPVRTGQLVEAGRRIGRVGMSGRATTPHLHFEVRLAGTPGLRWEKEEVVDPIPFVAARTADSCDTDSLGAYLEWAEYAGLVDAAPPPELGLPRSLWWHMLAAACRHSLPSLPRNAHELEDSLVSAGVLPEGSSASPTGRVSWKDMERDLARARTVGLRLPERPVETALHRETCVRWLGSPHPATATRSSPEDGRGPTVAAALLVLADLAPARAAAKSAKSSKRRGAHDRPPLLAHAHPAHRSTHARHVRAAPDTARTAAGEVTPGPTRSP